MARVACYGASAPETNGGGGVRSAGLPLSPIGSLPSQSRAPKWRRRRAVGALRRHHPAQARCGPRRGRNGAGLLRGRGGRGEPGAAPASAPGPRRGRRGAPWRGAPSSRPEGRERSPLPQSLRARVSQTCPSTAGVRGHPRLGRERPGWCIELGGVRDPHAFCSPSESRAVLPTHHFPGVLPARFATGRPQNALPSPWAEGI